MKWIQQEIDLLAKRRGFSLVTNQVLEQLPFLENFKTGILHLFIKHTSASLSINENADPTVREDLESHFNLIAPENASHYKHTFEGPDDMPAHIKSVIIGSSLSIPITDGQLNLGTWQGIYLCEHRSSPSVRIVLATINGEK
tara:strand:- start:342 stop:767 length:426 start_codon:yes stop_codon:yes gene_type:complete